MSENFRFHVDEDVQRFGSIPYGSENLVEGVLAERGRWGGHGGASASQGPSTITPLDPLTEKFCKAVGALDKGGEVLDWTFAGAETAAKAANGRRMPDGLGGLFTGPARATGFAEEALRAWAETRQGASLKGALAGAAARMVVDAAGASVGARLGAAAGTLTPAPVAGTLVGAGVGGVALPSWLDEVGFKDWAGDIAAGLAEGRKPTHCP